MSDREEEEDLDNVNNEEQGMEDGAEEEETNDADAGMDVDAENGEEGGDEDDEEEDGADLASLLQVRHAPNKSIIA